MHDFRRLRVWQLARELGVAVDVAVRRFPRGDRGVVSNQLRHAALSIHSNIAEGCGRSSRPETARFLQIASASAKETESHLVVAGDLGLLHPILRDQLIDQSRSIQRMLESLMRNLPWLTCTCEPPRSAFLGPVCQS
jgi:four helix bundle protein